MIRITNLVKSYGSHRTLDGVTLEVKAGDVTALVGPSGGGKSTLLRCVNALETFDSGTVAVGDVTFAGGQSASADRLIALRKHVGMVFQQFNLFPHLTALENVMSGPRYALGKSKNESRETAERLLNRVGLANRMQAKPATLSGGQQQRVAIARALAVQPIVLLLDEPTSALDPQMSAEVLEVLRDLAREGQTMIVVTHDMDLARQATVVHRMAAGKIVQSGPASDVLIR